MSSRSSGSARPSSSGNPATPDDASDRRQAFITWASCTVRRTVSPIRPMPCESEFTIPMPPSSWSGPSAAIRPSRIRSRTSCTSPGISHDSPWFSSVIGRCSAAAWTPNGSVGVVDEHRIDGSRTRPSRSGTWPPPEPSTWYAWTVRPAIAATVSSSSALSWSPSVWSATETSCASA